MDTYSHLLCAARFGDYAQSELSYARALIEAAPDHSLTLFDRLYYSAALLLDWQNAGNGRVRRFLTSLCDPIRYPATEVAQHYVWRWEIEMGFRDIKQGMLAGAPVLPSKLPELVRQEMCGMADELQIEPQRLSLRWLALTITWALTQWPLQTPGALPKRLAWLRAHARDYLLPPRRKCTYPGALKSGQRKYPIKNASQLD